MTGPSLTDQEKAWRLAQVDCGRLSLSGHSPAIQEQAELLFGRYLAGEMTQDEINQAMAKLLGDDNI